MTAVLCSWSEQQPQPWLPCMEVICLLQEPEPKNPTADLSQGPGGLSTCSRASRNPTPWDLGQKDLWKLLLKLRHSFVKQLS